MTSQLVDHCAPSLFCVPKPGGLARIRACVFVWTLTTDADYWNDVRELEPLEQRIKCWNLMMKYAAGQRALDAEETTCVCENAYVNMGMLSVCVSLYTTVLSLSLQLLMPNPWGKHSGFESGLSVEKWSSPIEKHPCENTQLICKRHFNMCVSWIRLWWQQNLGLFPCLWIYGRVAMAASSLACRVLWHVAIASLIREKRTISCRVTTTQSCDQMLATSIRMPEIKQQTSVIYISLLWTNLSHSDNHKKTNSQYFGCLVKLALLLCSKYSSISQNSCLLFSWDWCGFSVHSITCWYSPSCLSYCPQTFARSRSLSVSVSVLMTCLCSFWGEFSCSWSVLRQSWKPLLWLFCGQSLQMRSEAQ